MQSSATWSQSIPGMVGSMEGRGRTALGEDLAEAAGDAKTDFLDPSLVSASSLAIFSPDPSLASLGRFTAVKPCVSCPSLRTVQHPSSSPPHMQSISAESGVSKGPPTNIRGTFTRRTRADRHGIHVQLRRQQHHLSKQLYSWRHRDVLWDVIARRLAAELVHGGVARARIDIAPEHARGRVIHQGRRVRSLSQLIVPAQVRGCEGR